MAEPPGEVDILRPLTDAAADASWVEHALTFLVDEKSKEVLTEGICKSTGCPLPVAKILI